MDRHGGEGLLQMSKAAGRSCTVGGWSCEFGKCLAERDDASMRDRDSDLRRTLAQAQRLISEGTLEVKLGMLTNSNHHARDGTSSVAPGACKGSPLSGHESTQTSQRHLPIPNNPSTPQIKI